MMFQPVLQVFLALLHVFIGCFAGITFPDGESLALRSVQNEVSLVVTEGDTVTLPCVFPTKENLKENVFDWKKDNRTEVFMYDGGFHYNNGRTGQDKQYMKRVSYSEEQLLVGNAGLTLKNATVADSGRYSCHFPRLSRYTFYVTLLVSASPKPHTEIVDATENGGVLLKCEVQGASPKPQVEWQDSNRKALPTAEPLTSRDSEGRYNISLFVEVTKTDRYRCIAKQEEIEHMTDREIFVPEKMFSKNTPTGMMVGVGVLGWVIGVVTLAVILALLVAGKCIKISCGEDSPGQQVSQCLNCAELNHLHRPLASKESPDDSAEGD